MYYDFKVKIPEVKGKIYERTIKGVVYINYEYDRIYKPDKKYNISKRTTIGKKCEDDPEMMYPNPNFLTYFPDAELPEDQGRDARSSCLRIGTWIVIEKLMVESLLDKIISGLYSDDRGTGLFLDLAAYYLTTENNAGQYYPDYAYNHPLLHLGYHFRNLREGLQRPMRPEQSQGFSKYQSRSQKIPYSSSFNFRNFNL